MWQEYLPLILVSVFAIVAGVGLYCLIRYLAGASGRKKFIPEEVSLMDEWVDAAFRWAARSEVEHRYNISGKNVRTQRGMVSARFTTEASKEYDELIATCCSGLKFSPDFCQFLHSSSGDLRRNNLQSAIAGYIRARQNLLNSQAEQFAERSGEITPQEFFQIKNRLAGDIVGVYIIHNETTGQYYVGQAKRVYFRITQHFTGHGNGDVYADYKYGHDFSIKIIKLTDSGYDDIDLLEKTMIERYHAYTLGYNKTSGNGEFDT